MRVSTYLVVAQWALLFALGLLVIVAYRQMGRVFVRRAEKRPLGPPVGSIAGHLEYSRMTDGAWQTLEPGRGERLLVAFVDPTCLSCEKLVSALTDVRKSGVLDGVRILLLTSDPPHYLAVSDTFRTTSFEIGHIESSPLLEAYSPSATPLLVAIDATGVVRSAGPAATIEEVRDAVNVITARAGLTSDISLS